MGKPHLMASSVKSTAYVIGGSFIVLTSCVCIENWNNWGVLDEWPWLGFDCWQGQAFMSYPVGTCFLVFTVWCQTTYATEPHPS